VLSETCEYFEILCEFGLGAIDVSLLRATITFVWLQVNAVWILLLTSQAISCSWAAACYAEC